VVEREDGQHRGAARDGISRAKGADLASDLAPDYGT
jgi:hypothetical protein